MPLCAKEHALEVNYENKTLTEALQNAAPAVVSILKGERAHPVVKVFDDFMQLPWKEHRRKREEWDMAKASGEAMDERGAPNPPGRGSQGRRSLDFILHSDRQPLPVLPGDSSLFEPLLETVSRLVSTLPAIDGMHTTPWEMVYIVGTILFDLVIVRTYLRRTPGDDNIIWNLWWNQRRLRRNWLPGEVALAATQGQLYRELVEQGAVRFSRTIAARKVTTFSLDLTDRELII